MSAPTAGVLALHGFTGSPATLTPLTDALAAAGVIVSAPCLPGHGTRVEDMLEVTYDDWAACAAESLRELSGQVDRVVVFGQSMGGALAAQLAARVPTLAGAVFVNPAVAPVDPALLDIVDQLLAAGEELTPGGRSDIADPDAPDGHSYPETPLRPLRSLAAARAALQAELPRISCPVLIMTSIQDHVVDPSESDHLASLVSGPIERVMLERSYHVATLDHDRQVVIDHTLDFVRKVTSS